MFELRRLRTSILASFVSALLLSGCARKATWPDMDVAGHASPLSTGAPVADSPGGAIRCFAWDLNHLDPDRYTELLTDDFQFQFGLSDSAGNFYRDRGLIRLEELEVARHLLATGTATEPPAQYLQLTLGAFIPYPDSRPGKTYPWHLEIRTGVTLTIDTGDRMYYVTGSARFFVVRGDSARIPPDLAALGVGADPHRWWIERWEDETAGGYGGNQIEGTLPSRSTSWGSIKALYR